MFMLKELLHPFLTEKKPRENLRFSKPRFLKPRQKRAGGFRHTHGSVPQTSMKNL